MEKINIAELLKDCPSGMELDCAIRDRCRRYQLHLMRENIKVIEDYLTSYTMPQYKNGECEIMIKL